MSSSSTSLEGESRVRWDSSGDQLRVDDWVFGGASAVCLMEGLGSRFRWLALSSCDSATMGT